MVQNSALRIATGSTLMSSIQHLHSETLTLPLQHHLDMICSQFLASALRPTHPSHTVVTSHPGPRQMKQTLRSSQLHRVSPYLTEDGTIDPDSYKSTINSIHSDSVQLAIATLGASKVLGIIPPEICSSELNLPRACRTSLSLLRSCYSARLRSYQHRIDSTECPLRPECLQEPHTTHHVFSCSAHPTCLSAVDLWRNPCDVAAFLAGLEVFRDLPHQEDAPLHIPPEPPPGRGD